MASPPLRLGPELSDDEPQVDLLSARVVLDGFVRVERYDLRFRLFNGEWSQPVERMIASTGGSGHAAAALLYDPERDVVVLVEQFRAVNFFNRRPNAWNLEIAAGLIEPGEDPLATICREITEETGLKPLQVETVMTVSSSPGVFTERLHLFIARVKAEDGAARVHGLASENENLRSHVLSFGDALKLADEGWIDDAKTQLLLNWLARQHDALRHRWLNTKAD